MPGLLLQPDAADRSQSSIGLVLAARLAMHVTGVLVQRDGLLPVGRLERERRDAARSGCLLSCLERHSPPLQLQDRGI
jgi:hypothetical protein